MSTSTLRGHQVITEGTAIWTRDGMDASWIYVDGDTRIDTGTPAITDARRIVFEQCHQPVASAVRHTIESGPQRARAGHQRLRAWNFA
jgi:dTDP-glucose pyrophosphorylase